MRIRFRKRHGLISILVIVLILITSKNGDMSQIGRAAEQNQPGLYGVTRFVDGDTIVVNMNGHQEKVRFVGIDTPETHKPNTPVQCYGPAAAAFTKNVIGKNQVRLVSDSLSTDRDRYN